MTKIVIKASLVQDMKTFNFNPILLQRFTSLTAFVASFFAQDKHVSKPEISRFSIYNPLACKTLIKVFDTIKGLKLSLINAL